MCVSFLIFLLSGLSFGVLLSLGLLFFGFSFGVAFFARTLLCFLVVFLLVLILVLLLFLLFGWIFLLRICLFSRCFLAPLKRAAAFRDDLGIRLRVQDAMDEPADPA